jgi:endonuclease/exonuclease/phosphatase family metal-dependent hydrolase
MRVQRGILFAWIFFAQILFSAEIQLQVASLNIWGWGPKTSKRIDGIKKLLVDEKALESSKVLFIQESLAGFSGSTSGDLASVMGWKNFFVKRKGDSEGLAILYSPDLKVLEENYHHIEAKHNDDDYSRLVVSLLVEDTQWGKVRYVNTHLAHEAFMAETRKAQIKEVLEWLNGLEAKVASDWIILGGDFNTGPTEDYYKNEFDLLSESPFSFEHSKHEGAHYSWTNLESGDDLKTELVDHFHVGVLKESSARPLHKTKIKTTNIDQGLSDHALLLLTLKLNKDSQIAL